MQLKQQQQQRPIHTQTRTHMGKRMAFSLCDRDAFHSISIISFRSTRVLLEKGDATFCLLFLVPPSFQHLPSQ